MNEIDKRMENLAIRMTQIDFELAHLERKKDIDNYRQRKNLEYELSHARLYLYKLRRKKFENRKVFDGLLKEIFKDDKKAQNDIGKADK